MTILEMQDGSKVEFLTVWPDGTVASGLTSEQANKNWEHNYYKSHVSFQQNCYSCACEEAY